jgi:CRP-like cAMP-binding protein
VLRDLPSGEAIIREGEIGSSFFVVVSGRVRVEKRPEYGEPVLLAHLGEGAFFGEMALLSGAPRAAAVIAEEDTQLLEITADLLSGLCREHPGVARSLTRFYRQRLLANVMATSPLFRPFDKTRRRELMRRFRNRVMRPGEKILCEGLPSDGLYVILSGTVEIRKQQPTGEILAGKLREGDVFGEMSCLRKTPASATVVACRGGMLLRLPRVDFDEIVTAYPQVLALVAELADERELSLDAILAGRAEFTEDGLVLL